MADAPRDRLVLFASSAFHTAFFLLILVVLFYRGGAVGFEGGGARYAWGVFFYGVVMLSTLVGIKAGLSRLSVSLYDATGGEIVLAGVVAGGVTGVLSVFGQSLSGIAVLCLVGPAWPMALAYIAWFAFWGGLIGCVIGLVAIVIDYVIVLLVRFALGPEDDHRSEPARRATQAGTSGVDNLPGWD